MYICVYIYIHMSLPWLRPRAIHGYCAHHPPQLDPVHLQEKGLSTIFGELHDPKDDADEGADGKILLMCGCPEVMDRYISI